MRSAFAAAFPLISSPMYNRLGTVGATAFLAGLSLLMTPLPCVLLHFVPRAGLFTDAPVDFCFITTDPVSAVTHALLWHDVHVSY